MVMARFATVPSRSGGEIRLSNGDELGGVDIYVCGGDDGFTPMCGGSSLMNPGSDLVEILDQIAEALGADDWTLDDDPDSIVTIDAGDSEGVDQDFNGELKHGVDVDGESGRLLITGARRDVLAYMSDHGLVTTDHDEEGTGMTDDLKEDTEDLIRDGDDHSGDDLDSPEGEWTSTDDGYFSITDGDVTGGVVKVHSGDADQYIAFTIDAPESERAADNSSLFDDHGNGSGSDESSEKSSPREAAGFSLIGIYETPDEAAQAVEEKMDVHPDASIDEAINPYDGMSDDDIIESFSEPAVKRSSFDEETTSDDWSDWTIISHDETPHGFYGFVGARDDVDSDGTNYGTVYCYGVYSSDDDPIVEEGDVYDEDQAKSEMKRALSRAEESAVRDDEYDASVISSKRASDADDPDLELRFEIQDEDDEEPLEKGAAEYGLSLDRSYGEYVVSGPESRLEGFYYDYVDGKTIDPGDFEDFLSDPVRDDDEEEEDWTPDYGDDREIDDLDFGEFDRYGEDMRDASRRRSDVQYDANGNPVNDPSVSQDDGPVSSTDIHQEDDGTYSVSISGDDDRDNTNDPQLETYQGGFSSEADAQNWLTQRMMDGTDGSTASKKTADDPDYRHMYDSDGVRTVDLIPGDEGLTALILQNRDGEYGWEVHSKEDPYGYLTYDAGLDSEDEARSGAEESLHDLEEKARKDREYDESLTAARRLSHVVDVQMMQKDDGSYYWHLNVKGDDGQIILEDNYADEDLAMDAAKQAIESSDATPVIESSDGEIIPDENADQPVRDGDPLENPHVDDDGLPRPKDSDLNASRKTSKGDSEGESKEQAYLFHLDHWDSDEDDLKSDVGIDGVSHFDISNPDEVYVLATPKAAREIADSLFGKDFTSKEMSDARSLGEMVQKIRDGKATIDDVSEESALFDHGYIPDDVTDFVLNHTGDDGEMHSEHQKEEKSND